MIAASIILAANGMMNYHLSGSVREYSSLAANNLLLYEAALWGAANGYKSLYLGGGVGAREDSLFRFKRTFFKGELNHFFIGKKIYHQEKYDEFVEMRNVSEGIFSPDIDEYDEDSFFTAIIAKLKKEGIFSATSAIKKDFMEEEVAKRS